MSPPRKVWVVRGEVTDPSCFPGTGAKLGDTEWQFSDGPPGERGYSADYVDLSEGLATHADCALYHDNGLGGWAHGGSPGCEHNWVEWVGDDGDLLEPAMDVCNSCGATR